jgi:hypothetical protein
MDSLGFKHGYFGDPMVFEWHHIYRDAYARGARQGKSQREAEEAYSLECTYRDVEDLEEDETLEFVNSFYKFRDERVINGEDEKL